MSDEHSGERLRHAAVVARRAIAASHADGHSLADGAVLDLWHLMHEAERVAAELAPALAPAAPCLWAVEDPAYGMTVPAAVIVRLPDGRLARMRFDKVVRTGT